MGAELLWSVELGSEGVVWGKLQKENNQNTSLLQCTQLPLRPTKNDRAHDVTGAAAEKPLIATQRERQSGSTGDLKTFHIPTAFQRAKTTEDQRLKCSQRVVRDLHPELVTVRT